MTGESQPQSEGARAAGRAQYAAKARIPGFYVQNARTKIIVRGPFDSYAEADQVARSESIASWVVERLR